MTDGQRPIHVDEPYTPVADEQRPIADGQSPIHVGDEHSPINDGQRSIADVCVCILEC